MRTLDLLSAALCVELLRARDRDETAHPQVAIDDPPQVSQDWVAAYLGIVRRYGTLPDATAPPSQSVRDGS